MIKTFSCVGLMLALVTTGLVQATDMDVDLSDGPDIEAFHQRDKEPATTADVTPRESPSRIKNQPIANEGFLSGNAFLALEPASQQVYAKGLFDGILLSPYFLPSGFQTPQSKVDTFRQCTRGMTGQQLAAIFNKYLTAHPERWHNSMHGLALSALREICPV